MAHWRIGANGIAVILVTICEVVVLSSIQAHASSSPKQFGHTRVSIKDTRWHLNGHLTYPASQAEGLLMNVRMVNTVFEDRRRLEFDAEKNTNEFVAAIPEYAAHGVRAFTVNLQGGFPGYEGAVNSAFEPDGSLRQGYLQRVRRVIEACDRNGVVVILGCYYQRQDQILQDARAVRAGVVNVARWITQSRFSNVVLEIANEFNHSGFDHDILSRPEGQVELIQLAKETSPGLLVSTSGLGNGRLPADVAQASDFLLIHFNSTGLDDIPKRINALKKYGKPIVCNEDDKHGPEAAEAAQLSVEHGASWGFMHNEINQYVPFQFQGIEDDRIVYGMLQTLTAPKKAASYFPPPESEGGWRKLKDPDDVRRLGGMDPVKLGQLKQWLLESDKRNFAAVVIRNGYIVLEVERGNSSVTDARRVASVSEAVCATVLAIASEHSQQGRTPRRMSFDDPAFDFIPWAKPLSDPRKARITVKQLLNHTSGICPEATGARNDGTWCTCQGNIGPRADSAYPLSLPTLALPIARPLLCAARPCNSPLEMTSMISWHQEVMLPAIAQAGKDRQKRQFDNRPPSRVAAFSMTPGDSGVRALGTDKTWARQASRIHPWCGWRRRSVGPRPAGRKKGAATW